MAGEGRRALLDIIDEAAEIGDLHVKLTEAKNAYFTKRTQFWELIGKLERQGELERKLADANDKISFKTRTRHAEIVKAYQYSQKNRRELEETLDQLETAAVLMRDFARNLALDDWPTGAFSESVDSDMLNWKKTRMD